MDGFPEEKYVRKVEINASPKKKPLEFGNHMSWARICEILLLGCLARLTNSWTRSKSSPIGDIALHFWSRFYEGFMKEGVKIGERREGNFYARAHANQETVKRRTSYVASLPFLCPVFQDSRRQVKVLVKKEIIACAADEDMKPYCWKLKNSNHRSVITSDFLNQDHRLYWQFGKAKVG